MVSVTTPQAWGFSCEARLEPVYQPMGGVGAVAAVPVFFFSLHNSLLLVLLVSPSHGPSHLMLA